MNKLFESRNPIGSTASIHSVDSQIILAKALYIQYKQILIDKNFQQHLETVMVSKNILRMGAQKTTIQKTYEIAVGQDSFSVEF